MNKLIPLFIILLIMASALYFQEQILDRFMGPGSSTTQNSAPPGLPSLNIGNTSEAPELPITREVDNQAAKNAAPPGLPSLSVPVATEPEVENPESPAVEDLEFDGDLDSVTPDRDKQIGQRDNLSLDSLGQFDDKESSDEPLAAPPGLPALSFGPAPVAPASNELETNTKSENKLKVPEIILQEFKNSFVKFKYPQNITIQNVSLSSIDLNSIESKLVNVSYFNNEKNLNIPDFVADSSNITNFFEESTPVELSLENVEEVFLATDLVLQLKYYIVKESNLIVVIEMDASNEFEFVEQIIIPSIESQII